jgi:menaquinone-dependent protoporphyrinogen oxidase
MPTVLILYGTTDGHTAKVAGFVGGELRRLGANVEICDAATSDPDPEGYDGVVVAASVHSGQYQRQVVRWVRAHAQALRERRAEFLSICLGVLQKDPKVLAELGAIKRRFAARTGWQPAYYELVAGALPYTRYGWLKRTMMRRIARQVGGATDTSRDHEYTDWDDLRGFAESFYSLCAPEPEAPPKCWAQSACACVPATIDD